MQSTIPDISILLPAYNGAGILDNQLRGFIDFLQLHTQSFEIIIIDDGSKVVEKTRLVAEKYRCRFLSNSSNLGKGAAIKKGVLNARGKIILFTDADIPFEYESILRFTEKIDLENFDLVVGDRTHSDSIYFGEINKLRKLGSELFYFLVSKIFTHGLHDTQCGLKAFKAPVAKELFSLSVVKGFAFDVEILSIANQFDYQRIALPVKLRSKETSSVRMFYHGFGMLFDLIRIAYRLKTGYYSLTRKHYSEND